MSERTPICLLVDDPAPLIHVYRFHWEDIHGKPPITDDGRPLLDIIPNDFLDRFCDVMERQGIKGKFSIVPAPAGKGDIVNGIEGFDPELTRAWLDTVKSRVTRFCDLCPEGITHNFAVNLKDGGQFPESETAWSQHQSRETLTPYLTRELQYLKDAGIDASGVTSPWVFGIEAPDEYVASIVAAQKAVNNRTFSWFFLYMLYNKNDRPHSRPWVAHHDDEATLISIPGNIDDYFWATINSPRTDAAWIAEVADKMLTADGTAGRIIDVLNAGGWPVFVTHWQSFFSNGLETGLAVLDEVGRRVETHLSDRVEWQTCMQLARAAWDTAGVEGPVSKSTPPW